MAMDRNDLRSVPQLEAKHTWSGGVGVVLNDAQGDLPRVVLSRIRGLRSRSDSDGTVDKLPGRDGETPRQSQRRGKTVTYEGEIQAASLEQMRWLEGQLEDAFDRETVGTMTITPHPDYGGNTYTVTGRATACDIDDEQKATPFDQPSPWKRSVLIAVRMFDPRIYKVGATTVASSAALGGQTVSLGITNPGTDVDPLVKLYGPLVNPVIARDNNAAYMTLIGTVPAGQRVEIDFAARTLTLVDGGGGRSDWVNAAAGRSLSVPLTNWWDDAIEGLPAAASTWTMSQYSGFPGVGSSFQVVYTPAVR